VKVEEPEQNAGMPSLRGADEVFRGECSGERSKQNRFIVSESCFEARLS